MPLSSFLRIGPFAHFLLQFCHHPTHMKSLLLQVLGFMTLFAMVGPIGILIGSFVESVDALVFVLVDGLAAGAFLYIGSCEIMKEEFQIFQVQQVTSPMPLAKRMAKFFIVLSGIFVIAVLQLLRD